MLILASVAYNRVALTDYFQHRNVEKLYLNPRTCPPHCLRLPYSHRQSAEWYTSQDPSRFQFFLNEAVVSISPSEKLVTTSTSRRISYDICVLATGSDATLPEFVDHTVKGVFVYRNISDLNSLLAYSDVEGVKGQPVSYTV